MALLIYVWPHSIFYALGAYLVKATSCRWLVFLFEKQKEGIEMNSGKRNLLIVIGSIFAIVVGLFFFSEDGGEKTAENAHSSKASIEEVTDMPHVGLLQLTSHPSLDAIAQGIIDELEAEGFVDGETMTLDFQNGQGDQSTLNSMAQRFVNDDADVMIGIATPSALALANASSTLPIVLGAVTDPENVGLVETNEEPGGNVTGVSDMTPIRQQLELIRKLLPEATTLGIMYSSAEDNSVLQGDIAEELAPEFGFETVTRTVSSTNDVAQVGLQLVKEVDAIWVPNDNTVASAFPTLIEQSNHAGVAIFPAVDQMVVQGGLATLGLNQYQLGVATGRMAAAVLRGESDPATTPIYLAEEVDLIVNFEQAELLGIEIPKDISKDAQSAAELENGTGE